MTTTKNQKILGMNFLQLFKSRQHDQQFSMNCRDTKSNLIVEGERETGRSTRNTMDFYFTEYT